MIMVQRKKLNRSQESLEEELLFLLQTKQYTKYDKLLVDLYGIEPLVTFPERKGRTNYSNGSHGGTKVFSLDSFGDKLSDEEFNFEAIIPDKYEVI